MFDVKHKGVIDFSDFVRSLNVFHPNASQEVKIDCKLNIYYVMIFNCINWSCHCILHDPLHFILLSVTSTVWNFLQSHSNYMILITRDSLSAKRYDYIFS